MHKHTLSPISTCFVYPEECRGVCGTNLSPSLSGFTELPLIDSLWQSVGGLDFCLSKLDALIALIMENIMNITNDGEREATI